MKTATLLAGAMLLSVTSLSAHPSLDLHVSPTVSAAPATFRVRPTVVPDAVGGEFGKGVVSCKTAHGWSAPVFLTLEKGSFGAQIGAESTDLVLLVMNDHGIERLLQDKVPLGADASIAAGPVGRSGTAATDAQLSAEMLSYSRAHGLFAGIDLSGGVLRPDNDATRVFYGHSVADREVLLGKVTERIPATANPLIAALNGAHRSTAKHGA